MIFHKTKAATVPLRKKNEKRGSLKGRKKIKIVAYLALNGTQKNFSVRNTQGFGRKVCREAKKGKRRKRGKSSRQETGILWPNYF